MKTFRLIGMALFAVLMCVNYASCSSDDDPTEESTTDLSKTIIGVWVQDGDDDIMVIKADNTILWYGNEDYYKSGGEPGDIEKWEVKEEWVYFYQYDDNSWKLRKEMRPIEVKNNMISWKDYGYGYDSYNEYHDSYGNYRIWTWERYSK